eukprot:TRINITY_DN31633_c0_g1_i1.p1 TRINITY_DN31633_c0_g1~~TRINITY_DN31633_c0_g1_i1.p1  ORF type:complete len:230 (+),score=-21.66 TRINITY_DN31633_c0_g1_i1:361-1050(+)
MHSRALFRNNELLSRNPILNLKLNKFIPPDIFSQKFLSYSFENRLSILKNTTQTQKTQFNETIISNYNCKMNLFYVKKWILTQCYYIDQLLTNINYVYHIAQYVPERKQRIQSYKHKGIYKQRISYYCQLYQITLQKMHNQWYIVKVYLYATYIYMYMFICKNIASPDTSITYESIYLYIYTTKKIPLQAQEKKNPHFSPIFSGFFHGYNQWSANSLSEFYRISRKKKL